MESLSKINAEKLLSLIPMLIDWLCMNSENVGLKIAMKASSLAAKVPVKVLNAMKGLLRSRSLEELSNAVLRKYLKDIDIDIWFHVVLLTLSNTKCPLVSADCYKGLQTKLGEIRKVLASQVPAEQFISEQFFFLDDVLETLHRLNIVNFYALSSFCGVIHANEPIIERTCGLIAPRILLPEEEGAFEFKRDPSDLMKSIASVNSVNVLDVASEVELGESIEVLTFLCKYYEVLFAKKVKSYRGVCGYRENIVVKLDKNTIRIAARAKQLEDFYFKVDPDFRNIPTVLFQFFDFATIAEAIWKEYELLPRKWVGELALYKLEMSAKPDVMERLEWFDKQRDILVECGNDFYPLIAPKPKVFYKSEYEEELDKVVQELFCGEDVYYKRLKVFRDVYVPELIALSYNAPKKQLGLTTSEIRRVFGARLDKVIESTRTWLIQLEVLRLIRSDVLPGKKGQLRTRAGLLAEALILHEEHFLFVYNEYTKSQSSCMEIVNAAITLIESQKNKASEIAFTNVFENFISEYPEQMLGQGLDSIMNSPVRRFPQYTLFFDRMLKLVKKRPGNYSQEIKRLEEATELCKSVAYKLNKGAEREKRLRKIIGDRHDLV